MNCASCGSVNREGRRFCGKCGAPLAKVCAACNAVYDNDESFCGQCGAAARLAIARGRHLEVAALLRDAVDLFESMKMPFWVAVTRLEQAEWLITQGRSAEADDLLALASTTFAELHAVPWHRRATQAAHDGPAAKEATTAMRA
jgi:uncharacterized OB-fold protein